MASLRNAFLSISLALLLAACTTAEWGRIGTDAVEAAPGVLADPQTYVFPWGTAVVGAGLIALLFRKSLARGFGKGAKWTTSGIGALLTKLFGEK